MTQDVVRIVYMPLGGREQVRLQCPLEHGVARNLIWGVNVLTSHCNFKTCVNVPHVNKTVTDFGDIGPYIHRYTPVATPLRLKALSDRSGDRSAGDRRFHMAGPLTAKLPCPVAVQ